MKIIHILKIAKKINKLSESLALNGILMGKIPINKITTRLWWHSYNLMIINIRNRLRNNPRIDINYSLKVKI